MVAISDRNEVNPFRSNPGFGFETLDVFTDEWPPDVAGHCPELKELSMLEGPILVVWW